MDKELWELHLYRVVACVQTINVFVLLAVLTWVLLR